MSELSFTFSPKECLLENRADAFYFQPRFKRIKKVIEKLGSITELKIVAKRSDRTRNPQEKPDQRFKYVQIDDIDTYSGKVYKLSTPYGDKASPRARKSLVKDSILISTVRPLRNAIALMPDELEGEICSTAISVIVPKPIEVNKYYLWAFLRSEFGNAQLEQLGRGASYPAILEHEIDRIIIPRLADCQMDEISAMAQEIINLEKKGQEIILGVKAAFENVQMEITPKRHFISTSFTPENMCQEARADVRFFDARYTLIQDSLVKNTIGQEIVELQDICFISRGVQPIYSRSGTIPTLKIADVRNTKVIWNKCKKENEDFVYRNPRGIVRKADIVVTATGEGSWGRVAIVDRDIAFAAVDLLILRVRENVDPYCLTGFLWSRAGQSQFAQRIRGSTGQSHLYERDIRKIKILIPKKEKAERLSQNIKIGFEYMNRAEETRTILKKYFYELVEECK